METFHIFHLAASWKGKGGLPQPVSPPLTTSPVHPNISQPPSTQTLQPNISSPFDKPNIKAAAVHMVFASRSSQDFITPHQVTELETWSGLGVLEALKGFFIASDVRQRGLWHLRQIKVSDFESQFYSVCIRKLVVFGHYSRYRDGICKVQREINHVASLQMTSSTPIFLNKIASSSVIESTRT